MLGDRTGGLFERVADDAGGGSNLVDAFEVQGKGAQFIGEVADGAVPDGRLHTRRAAGAVQPPLEVGGFESGPGVFRMSKLAGIEDAEGSEGVGEVGETAVELVVEQAAGTVPLALDDGEAGAQGDADVWGATVAAALSAGGQAVVAEELGEEDVGGFFADGFGVGWHGIALGGVLGGAELRRDC